MIIIVVIFVILLGVRSGISEGPETLNRVCLESLTAEVRSKRPQRKPEFLRRTRQLDPSVSGKIQSVKPHSFVHKGREVKLCCKSCLKDFNEDPKNYINKIDDASKKDAKE